MCPCAAYLLIHYLDFTAATNGSDYLILGTSLVFPADSAGFYLQCVDVAIIDSPTVEEDETFTVTLSTVNVAAFNDVTTVTITDTDSTFYIHY